jgi:hypothetical protein
VISFFTTTRHNYTLGAYLKAAGQQKPEFTWIPYRALQQGPMRLRPGAVIFADVERLTTAATSLALRQWEALHEDPNRRVLNHPTHSMRRYELLRSRYEAGLNDFNVYHLTSAEKPKRWPVFVRNENDHDGALSGLLRNEQELSEYDRQAIRTSQPREQRLVVEWCDVRGAQGLIRKYSAFRVGERIVPRHVFFSRNVWCLKQQDLVTPELMAEEQLYVEHNPHQSQLREIFDAARIGYGRIDYSLKGDRIQVWEINTNPMIVRAEQLRESRGALHARFCAAISDAFRQL